MLDPAQRRPRVPWWLLVPVVALGATSAHAARQRQVALFIAPQHGVKPALVDRLGAEIKNLSDGDKTVALVPYKKLRRRLGRNMLKRVTSCGANMRCIAKLGRKVRADEVVYGRVKINGAVVTAQFVTIDVGSAKIARRASFDMARVADVEAQVGANAEGLLGIAGAAPAAAPADAPAGEDDFISGLIDTLPLDGEPPLEGVEAPAAESGAEVAEADAAASNATTAGEPEPAAPDAPPPSEEPALDALASLEPEALPEATQDSTDEPSLPGLDPVEDSGSAATANDSTLGASATVTPAWNRRRLALFGGAGAAGLGALLVGVGSVYGLDSRSTKGSITNSTDQRTAVRLGDEANASASKANTLFIIGSIALTVGGSAAAVAWFQPQWLGGDTLAVAPTPDGRGLAVAGRW